MYLNNKPFGLLLTSILSLTVLGVSTVNAQNRDEARGYFQDSRGNIVTSEYGDCWHTDTWKPENATIVGCDGVVVDAKVEVIKGAPAGKVSKFVVPAAALFAFDSADLSDEGKEAIEEYRAKWQDIVLPEWAGAYAGVIIGHTDSTGDPKYNLGLSKRRAEAVREYLVETGAPADKLRVVGRGMNNPIASNNTKEGRAQNRRVEVVVIGEARALDTMRFPSVALFPRRSAELTDQGKALLETNRKDAEQMLRRAEYIEITGHTDDVGDDDYNQDLSEQRARSVRNYLVSTGVDGSKIATVGAGEKMPIASNNTDVGRAENRRVEVLVLGRLEP